MAPRELPASISLTNVPGYFMQDEMSTDPVSFDYTTGNLGLLNRSYCTDQKYDPRHTTTQWRRFQQYVSYLNGQSEHEVQYKVLYLGRHGEGLHNVAESLYGTEEWDLYWSKLSGDSASTWIDAHLTPKGINQARTAHGFWKRGIEAEKIPPPERYYVSPLYRCLETADITFSALQLPDQSPFIAEVKELLRETIGVHTCDQRSSKSFIHEHFPSVIFESGFAEIDELWTPDQRETEVEQDERLSRLLQDVFCTDKSTHMSITAHSGTIASILRVIGHRPFSLPTGSVIPVFIRVETIAEISSARSLESSSEAPASVLH